MIKVDLEPGFIGLGPYHILVGMNNRIWIYNIADDMVSLIRDREYLGTIHSVRVSSDYASVFFEGKLQLHLVSSSGKIK